MYTNTNIKSIHSDIHINTDTQTNKHEHTKQKHSQTNTPVHMQPHIDVHMQPHIDIHKYTQAYTNTHRLTCRHTTAYVMYIYIIIIHFCTIYTYLATRKKVTDSFD